MAKNTSKTYSNYVAETLFNAKYKWSIFKNHHTTDHSSSFGSYSEALKEKESPDYILVCYPVVSSELYIALVEE